MKYKIKSIKQILKEHKLIFYLCLILFTLNIIIGSIFSERLMKSELYRSLEERARDFCDDSFIKLTTKLIISNLLTDLKVIALAIIGFPFLYIILNPILIGGVVTHFSTELGIIKSILTLIPHGIFEIPSMFLTAIVSLNIFFVFVKIIFKKKKFPDLIQAYADAFKIFFLLVVPLLIVAGIIEGSLIYFM